MEDEQLENNLYEARRIEQLGFMDRAHFDEFVSDAINGLANEQGAFFRGIAVALAHADFERSIKLLWAFKQDLEQAAMLWKMHEAKKKATSES